MPLNTSHTLSPHPADLLQHLIRLDTTNPPGNEAIAIEYIRQVLAEAGIEAQVLGRTPERTNLVARVKGTGNSAPLMLYGHVDVVTTAGQNWQVPPFEGRIEDGYVWGRGALDMKGEVAMFLAALLKAKADGLPLPGDVLFAALSDEEARSEYGARFLVREHPELFAGVRYAFGEFGGFNLSMVGRRFYPIMIAEKQICAIKATFRGQGGHGSMPVAGQAMARLSRALHILDRNLLPVHITPPVRLMIDSIANGLSGPAAAVLRQLTNPRLADRVLSLLGERGRLFLPLLRHTVSPTMLQASDKINVIPAEIYLGLDGRMLPGADPQQMLAELGHLLGDLCDLEVVEAETGQPPEPDMGLFDRLAGVLREFDPQGYPVPYVLSGVTDARFFSRLGIQTYGFTPLQMPEDFGFFSIVHAANERVPVAALEFGTRAIYRALQQF